ncbi:MAG: insulinase family protein [Candidatus Marinimicrobia bacterium]|nr:insulinase family protein [Candidatus Neomarinimicrobiota bacterium]
MKLTNRLRIAGAVGLLLLGACAPMPGGEAEPKTLSIEYESYTLENGLEVILHEDRSDPIVSVAIMLHVGSNRETPGRTGFAHLFEHILFQESEHVGQDQFFKNISGAGGTLNGGTWEDGTVYFEVVPKNALEMVLWMESDRMGFLLGKVTQEAFINQQDVVQNEKRQRVDNRPYGNTSYILSKGLYPEGHPYNWQVIGELEDLANATLDDVVDFYKRWYGPNNATLVVAGDYDVAQTKAWIEKYFGEIKRGPAVVDFDPMPAPLPQTKRFFHEDNFAKSPELNMAFPTVHQVHADAWPLAILADLLSSGKKSPMYKVIVEEKKLAPSVSARSSLSELAGFFNFRVRTFPDKSLSDTEMAIAEALARFESDGFSDQDLSRVKATLERSFYNSISSILGKSFQLTQYAVFYGSPGFVTQDIANYQNVTKDDVWRVYNMYIKDKPFVQTSFVPKGQTDLVAEGAELFPLKEEDIAMGTAVGGGESSYIPQPTPSSFNRDVMPPFGADPVLSLPHVWRHTLSNGLEIVGIEQHELPLISFSLTMRGGTLLDDMDKLGAASMVADMLMEGTADRTPIELEEAIDLLGSRISTFSGREAMGLSANTLASRFDETFALMEEILLQPRWDTKEFKRLKAEAIEAINRSAANPSSVATNAYNKLVLGKDNILAYPTIGTKESVDGLTMDDLKSYYERFYSPSEAWISIAGDITKAEAVAVFKQLDAKWPAKMVATADPARAPKIDKTALYFIDIPGAKQSQIRIGGTGPVATDEIYYPLYVMNYKLGGNFTSNLNLILREEKGYTYGARSGFSGGHNYGLFTASSGVRSNVTYESLEIFRDEIASYRDGISDEDLQFTKDALVKSNARKFETLGALMGMINQVANYDRPVDYVKQQEQFILGLTKDGHRELAQKYLPVDNMIYLVVGDAETQLARLKDLGLGDPILLEVD